MQEILEFFTIKWSKPWFLTCFAITSLGKPCTGSQDAKAGNLNPGVEFSGKNWSTQEIYELTKAELANVGIQPTKLELVSIFYIYIRICNMCTKQKKCMQSVKTWNVNVSPAYWLLARDLIMSFTSSWKKNRLPDAKSLKGLGTPLLPTSGVILHPKTLDDLVLRCNGSIRSFPQEKLRKTHLFLWATFWQQLHLGSFWVGLAISTMRQTVKMTRHNRTTIGETHGSHGHQPTEPSPDPRRPRLSS